MRARPPLTHLHLPLLVALLAASCSGQHATATSGKSSPASEAPARDTAQIAEYVVEVFEDSKGHLWFGTMIVT